MSFITPSSVAEILTALGIAFATVLGAVLVRARKEKPKPGSPDAAAAALAENTAELHALGVTFKAMQDQFTANNGLFHDVLGQVRDIREAAEASRDHLSAIRERRPR